MRVLTSCLLDEAAGRRWVGRYDGQGYDGFVLRFCVSFGWSGLSTDTRKVVRSGMGVSVRVYVEYDVSDVVPVWSARALRAYGSPRNCA